jgi:hypothetical protein
MIRCIVLLLVLAIAPRAHAGTVGVVVTGDSELQAALSRQLEVWLRSHGHTVGETLPPDATRSLLDCMIIDDEGCARGIVEARAKSASIVFAEIRKPRTRASNATTLIVYWLVKGKEPVGMRRACAACTEDLLASTLDEILRTVIGASELPRGVLVLASKPHQGMTVILDNQNIGITPLEREIPAGPHTIVLMWRGRKVAERTLEIDPEVTAEITMTATLPIDPPPRRDPPSRVLPGITLAVGGTAIVAGALLYFTSDVDDGTKPRYRDDKPVGIGLAAGGAALVAAGALWWLRHGKTDSQPTVAIDRDAGYVGWTRAF